MRRDLTLTGVMIVLVAGCQGAQGMEGGFTDAEIAACQSKILGAAQGSSSTHELYFGGFQEAAGTLDPTGGLIIANLPLEEGPIYGQMLNTYLDCNGPAAPTRARAAGRVWAALARCGSWAARLVAAGPAPPRTKIA